MDKWLVFTRTNARWVKSDVRRWPRAVLNPDVTHMLKVPMIYWKLVGASIEEMTPEEKVIRDLEIEKHGVVNFVSPPKIKMAVTLPAKQNIFRRAWAAIKNFFKRKK